jgi:GTPase involved in cell partitioning and DNA repair
MTATLSKDNLATKMMGLIINKMQINKTKKMETIMAFKANKLQDSIIQISTKTNNKTTKKVDTFLAL